MGHPTKYTHQELVDAVQRLQDLGDFNNEVDASRRAGEILNKALDAMEKGLVEGVVDTVPETDGEGREAAPSTGFDDDKFKL